MNKTSTPCEEYEVGEQKAWAGGTYKRPKFHLQCFSGMPLRLSNPEARSWNVRTLSAGTVGVELDRLKDFLERRIIMG